MVAKYSKFLFVVFLLITLIDIVIVVVAGCLKKLWTECPDRRCITMTTTTTTTIMKLPNRAARSRLSTYATLQRATAWASVDPPSFAPLTWTSKKEPCKESFLAFYSLLFPILPSSTENSRRGSFAVSSESRYILSPCLAVSLWWWIVCDRRETTPRRTKRRWRKRWRRRSKFKRVCGTF